MADNDALVTIIIPTKNRHRILYNSLKYYIKNRFRGKILILDFSTKKSIKATQRVCERVSKDGLDISLHHVDSIKHIGMAIQSVSSQIKTPYVLQCHDGEIAIVNGVIECVNFLKMNSEYIAASGTKCIKTQHKDIVGMHYIPCLELETRYVRDRLAAYFRSSPTTLHYLHRTEIWTEMFKYSHLISNNWIGSEILPGAIAAARGKIKDVLKTSRYRAIFSTDDSRYCSKHINPIEWWGSEDYIKSMKVLKSVIIKLLVEGGMSQVNARSFFERELLMKMMMVLLYKIVEKYPHLKPAIDAYSASLDTYPFPWRRNEIETSLTLEPDIQSFFKKEPQKYGKSDPFGL